MIIGSELIHHKKLKSTNTEASLMLKKKEIKEGTVLYTDFQTEGRGQAGNRWESEAGNNLLISVILYPSLVNPDEQFLISMAISLGICDFTDRHVAGSKIKWPNDIYINNDKIAGILIESSIMGETIESSIAGIGLNINQDKFPGNLGNPVSLKILTGIEYDLKVCLNQLLHDLDKRYKQLLYGDRNQLTGEYNARLYRLMEWHSYRTDDKTFTGRILNVFSSGKIQIGDADGKVSEFLFREVDFIP